MQREIKFRAMTIKGIWVYGLLSISHGSSGQPSPGHYISNSVGMPWAYNVRPETIGQFTNLRDKAQVDIYEQDIIDYGNRLYEVAVNFNGYYLQRYKLWRGKFVPAFQYSMCLITRPSKDRFGGKVDSALVIGNLFQNAELLQTPQQQTP